MFIKNLSVHANGGQHNVTVGKEDHAVDVLKALGLKGYELFHHGDTKFTSGDRVYDFVTNGAGLKATPLGQPQEGSKPAVAPAPAITLKQVEEETDGTPQRRPLAAV